MEAIYNNSTNVLTISNAPNYHQTHNPTHICCVIDVSGSMGSSADIKNENNQVERTGLSILDVVIHSVKTVIKSLTPTDKISIVSFSDIAKVVVNPTLVTDYQSIFDEVDKMKPTSMTNLWEGVRTGLDLIKSSDLQYNSSLLVFTDGMPNVDPPRGYETVFDRYGTIPCNIHTFGFGYSINTDLLVLFAGKGTGTYNFIPDAGMVGTVFIHAIANILSECAKKIMYGEESLGSLRYGQPRTIMTDRLRDTVTYYNDKGILKEIKVQQIQGEIDRHLVDRYNLINCMNNVLDRSCHDRMDVINNHERVITTPKYLEDLRGQIKEAVEPSAFDKWGYNYLWSLKMAHFQQYCNNFKDPGVQDYAQGTLFNQERDHSEEEFASLPAPTSRVVSYQSRGGCRGGGESVPVATPVNMSRYYLNASAGCFSGDSTIFDGTNFRRVDTFEVGDKVFNIDGKVDSIKYIVRSPYAKMYEIDKGLRITEWHPIMINGKWVFPRDLGKSGFSYENCYNMVLDSGMGVYMGKNSTKVITLGHGINNDLVASHSYFGNGILADLFNKVGSNGTVWVNSFVRDSTGLVCGIKTDNNRRGSFL